MKTNISNVSWGVFFGSLLTAVFYWISQVNLVMFHLVAGTAAVCLALGVAMVTVNAQKWLANHFYLIVAIGLIFVSIVDFVQTIMFSGSRLTTEVDMDLVYQLWVFSSLLLAFSFILAFFYTNRRLTHTYEVILAYLVVTAIGLYLIITKMINLKLSDEMSGIGLVVSLMVIVSFLTCIVRLISSRDKFQKKTWVFLLMALGIFVLAQVVSNISIINYVVADSFADISRFLAYYCLYQGIVVVAINNPENFIFSEIQKKQQEMQAINDELKIFKLAMENASDHIIITDTNARIIFVNRAAEQITGYSAAEIIGKTPALWGKQMPLEYYQNMWKTIKTDKKPFHGEVNNKRKNGEGYTSEIHITPILDEKGNLVNFLALEQDMSKRIMVDRMKSDFITVASHQLRTPLSASKWFLEMFKDKDFGDYTDKQADALKNLTESNQRMISIVNGLLNVSRIDAGSLKVTPEEIDIQRLISEVLLGQESMIKNHDIVVVKDFSPDLKQISSDRKLTTEVLKILLDNACIYSAKGGKLTVSVEKKDNNMLVKMADQGLGIPKGEQSQVFSRFFRASNAIKTVTEGSGLGLYFAKELVEAMGGTIGFESIEGEGSTFWFTIPLNMTVKSGFVSLDT